MKSVIIAVVFFVIFSFFAINASAEKVEYCVDSLGSCDLVYESLDQGYYLVSTEMYIREKSCNDNVCFLQASVQEEVVYMIVGLSVLQSQRDAAEKEWLDQIHYGMELIARGIMRAEDQYREEVAKKKFFNIFEYNEELCPHDVYVTEPVAGHVTYNCIETTSYITMINGEFYEAEKVSEDRESEDGLNAEIMRKEGRIYRTYSINNGKYVVKGYYDENMNPCGEWECWDEDAVRHVECNVANCKDTKTGSDCGICHIKRKIY
jgi:hypothetical protein